MFTFLETNHSKLWETHHWSKQKGNLEFLLQSLQFTRYAATALGHWPCAFSLGIGCVSQKESIMNMLLQGIIRPRNRMIRVDHVR
jgi:hypothetical protein